MKMDDELGRYPSIRTPPYDGNGTYHESMYIYTYVCVCSYIIRMRWNLSWEWICLHYAWGIMRIWNFFWEWNEKRNIHMMRMDENGTDHENLYDYFLVNLWYCGWLWNLAAVENAGVSHGDSIILLVGISQLSIVVHKNMLSLAGSLVGWFHSKVGLKDEFLSHGVTCECTKSLSFCRLGRIDYTTKVSSQGCPRVDGFSYMFMIN